MKISEWLTSRDLISSYEQICDEKWNIDCVIVSNYFLPWNPLNSIGALIEAVHYFSLFLGEDVRLGKYICAVTYHWETSIIS